VVTIYGFLDIEANVKMFKIQRGQTNGHDQYISLS